MLLTGGPLRPAGLISERRFKPSLGVMLIIWLLQRPSVGGGLYASYREETDLFNNYSCGER